MIRQKSRYGHWENPHSPSAHLSVVFWLHFSQREELEQRGPCLSTVVVLKLVSPGGAAVISVFSDAVSHCAPFASSLICFAAMFAFARIPPAGCVSAEQTNNHMGQSDRTLLHLWNLWAQTFLVTLVVFFLFLTITQQGFADLISSWITSHCWRWNLLIMSKKWGRSKVWSHSWNRPHLCGSFCSSLCSF